MKSTPYRILFRGPVQQYPLYPLCTPLITLLTHVICTCLLLHTIYRVKYNHMRGGVDVSHAAKVVIYHNRIHHQELIWNMKKRCSFEQIRDMSKGIHIPKILLLQTILAKIRQCVVNLITGDKSEQFTLIKTWNKCLTLIINWHHKYTLFLNHMTKYSIYFILLHICESSAH